MKPPPPQPKWRSAEGAASDEWADLTRRVAVDAVQTARDNGKRPPAEAAAAAAMTEAQLIDHRTQNGSAKEPLSPVMRLVEADHLRRAAEARADQAHQDRLDAQDTASVARVETERANSALTAAREQMRGVRTEAALKEQAWIAEREQLQHAWTAERAQLQQGWAAEREALQQTSATERAELEQALLGLRAQLEQVTADANTAIAAANERADAADARAAQRSQERAEAAAANEQALAQLRSQLDQVSADATTDVAAARGWAKGEVAAARDGAAAEVARIRDEADAEVARIRDEAGAEVARARDAADEAIRQSRAAIERASATQLLSIPIPPLEVRAQSRHLEDALNAVQTIDYTLEVGMAEGGDPHYPLDIEQMRSLVWITQEHCVYLANEAAEAPAGGRLDAAAGYAVAAADAFRAFLQRIEAAVEPLRRRDRSPDVEIVDAVLGLLADPWVQHARSRSASS